MKNIQQRAFKKWIKKLSADIRAVSNIHCDEFLIALFKGDLDYVRYQED